MNARLLLQRADPNLPTFIDAATQWDTRTYNLIRDALGLQEAEHYLNESGVTSGYGDDYSRMLDVRRQRLGELLMNWPNLLVKGTFHPFTWALIDHPDRRDEALSWPIEP
jgi:hypothetical protein